MCVCMANCSRLLGHDENGGTGIVEREWGEDWDGTGGTTRCHVQWNKWE